MLVGLAGTEWGLGEGLRRPSQALQHPSLREKLLPSCLLAFLREV